MFSVALGVVLAKKRWFFLYLSRVTGVHVFWRCFHDLAVFPKVICYVFLSNFLLKNFIFSLGSLDRPKKLFSSFWFLFLNIVYRLIVFFIFYNELEF